MKKGNPPIPTEAELEILRILWENGKATVKFVNDRINEKRETGYTTTLKLMQIMAEKGILMRDTEGKSHIYSPAFEEKETQKVLLNKFLDAAFGGSAMKLAMQLLGNRKTTSKELEQIKELINKIERGEK
ncbi:MAG TPA: BlaI/MecI/CopY family transcriptional regulator [Ignavibacteriales bacterium]|nr:BlaI/MecI/CopY family transcriptional regulator [Ignavibacteriales bacterium]